MCFFKLRHPEQPGDHPILRCLPHQHRSAAGRLPRCRRPPAEAGRLHDLPEHGVHALRLDDHGSRPSEPGGFWRGEVAPILVLSRRRE